MQWYRKDSTGLWLAGSWDTTNEVWTAHRLRLVLAYKDDLDGIQSSSSAMRDHEAEQ